MLQYLRTVVADGGGVIPLTIRNYGLLGGIVARECGEVGQQERCWECKVERVWRVVGIGREDYISRGACA